MHHILESTRAPRDIPALWREENARGLECADFADWEAAVHAFATAADLVATSEPIEPDAHDVLALVLGNLAHACFRQGHVDDAIRHAQRSCALRVALVGEDAVAVARARSDLAVMLSAVGRSVEASALIARAISGVEQYAGIDDLRLVALLENAARVQMVLGDAEHALPFLDRMERLLASHGLPTTRADALRDRVPMRHAAGAAETVPATSAATTSSLPTFAEQLQRGLVTPRVDDGDIFRGVSFDIIEASEAPPVAHDSANPPVAASLGFEVEYGLANYTHSMGGATDIDQPPFGEVDDTESDIAVTGADESDRERQVDELFGAPEELLLLDVAQDEVVQEELVQLDAARLDVSNDDDAFIASLRTPISPALPEAVTEPPTPPAATKNGVHPGHFAPRERRPFASALRTGRAAPKTTPSALTAAASTVAEGAAAVLAYLKRSN